ncbi:FecR family protein [Parapedobacter sp. 2B3]|uniref:FecR family protein n=1 Tax=Parapedobacter sp. 2B3 TaxID=3342381 RepID=UPI0035B5F351
MNHSEHIRQLFQKYLNNSCTPAEAQELWQFMQSGEKRDYLEHLIEQQLQDEHAELNPAVEDAVKNVFDKLRLEPMPKKKGRKTYLFAAAACILITLSYLSLQYIKSNDEAGYTVHNDIAAGGNKATLTLSDGAILSLDDHTIGNLVAKEGITIQKTATGQLVYHVDGEKVAEPMLNTVSTPRGGQFQVLLPDGTKVWLNASSSLTFPTVFDEKERKVSLSGEGYFEVSTQQRGGHRVPFIVETASQRIEVLGTHFNVNDYADEGTCNTTLLEGSVRIIAAEQSIVLKPGQQSKVGHETVTVATVDVESAVDWKNGDFLFADESLKSIMLKIARWYDVDVVYEKDMPTERYSGLIARSKNLSEVLHILKLSGALEARIENRTVYLSTVKD